MTKFTKAVFIFTLIFVVSFGLTQKVNASIINTLNISVQNPPTPPAPPKKPEPPLPPNIPTPTSKPTSAPTPGPTADPGNGSQGGSSSSGSDGLGCATHDCSGGRGGAPAGQVLGSGTMAGTGTFTENLYLAIMILGATLTLKGAKNIKKAFKMA